MSKNKPLYVQIPVGYICIPSAEFLKTQAEISDLMDTRYKHLRTIGDLHADAAKMKAQLDEASKKVARLEKDVNEKQDGVLYWYQKYTDLADKLNAVKDHAEAEET